MKHTEGKFHYIQNLIESGQIVVKYIASEENLADVLREVLAGTKFQKMKDGLCLV